MTESAEDNDRLPGERAVDVLAAIAAGGVLVASTEPSAIMLASTLPVMASVAFELDRKAWTKRMVRGGRVLQSAAEELDMTVDELAQHAGESDERTELLGRVIEAAAATLTLDSKIKALAKALVMGLADDAKVDPAATLVSTLAAVEAPHVRVLGIMANQYSLRRVVSKKIPIEGTEGHDSRMQRFFHRGWIGSSDIQSGLQPGWRHPAPPIWGKATLEPIVKTLVSNALCDEYGIPSGGLEPEYGARTVWRITPFGFQLLEFLEAEIVPRLDQSDALAMFNPILLKSLGKRIYANVKQRIRATK